MKQLLDDIEVARTPYVNRLAKLWGPQSGEAPTGPRSTQQEEMAPAPEDEERVEIENVMVPYRDDLNLHLGLDPGKTRECRGQGC